MDRCTRANTTVPLRADIGIFAAGARRVCAYLQPDDLTVEVADGDQEAGPPGEAPPALSVGVDDVEPGNATADVCSKTLDE